MTTGTLQERMMTISRYFTREKWKNETGIFQYPRGKRRTDAVVEGSMERNDHGNLLLSGALE